MWSAGPAPRPLGGVRTGALGVKLGLMPGMKVGLFGGSFDPAHEGHAHVAETAMRRLGLDRVIWLVSPGNPLKPHAPAELGRRMKSASAFAGNWRMLVSDAETRLGVRYTIDTVRALKARYPGVRFVWIMGADNLAQFHRWQNWQRIASQVPIAVIDRPPQSFRALTAPAAQALARYRLPESEAGRLACRRPPAWVFLTGLKLNVSSTGLRNPDGSWK